MGAWLAVEITYFEVPLACCYGVKYVAGETTVGRNDEADITIADPSVSGSHATIDVVDLPTADGKRVTLKVRYHGHHTR